MMRRTHAAFLDAMRTRLASADFPALEGLTTRDPADFSLALLDAWATAGDVLSFYGERIWTEFFLDTATERRSLVELARLVGYTPRPGLAATTHLAFTMEPGAQAEIPAGTRVQNVPVQGQLPQSYETSEPILAREELNRVGVRARAPQRLARPYESIWLRGTATGLAPDDGILIEDPKGRSFCTVQAVEPDPDRDRTLIWLVPPPAPDPVTPTPWETIRQTLRGEAPALEAAAPETGTAAVEADPVNAVRDTDVRQAALDAPDLLPLFYKALGAVGATEPPSVTVYALRVKARVFGHNAPRKPTYFTRNSVPRDPAEWIDWDRSHAPARNNPSLGTIELSVFERRRLLYLDREYTGIQDGSPVVLVRPGEQPQMVGGPAGDGDAPTRAIPANRARYGLAGACTLLDLGTEGRTDRSWWPPDGDAGVGGGGDAGGAGDAGAGGAGDAGAGGAGDAGAGGAGGDAGAGGAGGQGEIIEGPDAGGGDAGNNDGTGEVELVIPDEGDGEPAGEGTHTDRPPTMKELRTTVVYTAPERLQLADEPVPDDVSGSVLELDTVYQGLEPGRLLAVSGLRSLPGIPGVPAAEVVRVADVVHLAALTEADTREGDRNHTLVRLDAPLQNVYARDTVTVAGNVVAATQGETKAEVLGSGDASVPRQQFPLRSSPVTHVPADTPTGAEPALEVRVDDVTWPLRATPVGLGPDDRGYLLQIDDQQAATVVGLDGRFGRRFPSGTENIRARYRVGLGRVGNVAAGAINLLATKPLGVSGVVNPVPATGGADPERPDDIRRNVAVPLKALDRLVSVPDYADFARAFAGIGKSDAQRLLVGHRPVIVVTVAGVDDAPIAADSELRRNLARALRRFGDPTVGIRVVVRELLVVRLGLEVTIDPDRDWPVVAGQVQSALLDALSFARRDLGQDVVGSEILAAAHRVPGVRRCLITTLTSAPPPPAGTPVPPPPGPRLVVLPARGGDPDPSPAQLAYLAPELPEYLVLTRGSE
jgi:uncharacterized phage protein gp47/JayE